MKGSIARDEHSRGISPYGGQELIHLNSGGEAAGGLRDYQHANQFVDDFDVRTPIPPLVVSMDEAPKTAPPCKVIPEIRLPETSSSRCQCLSQVPYAAPFFPSAESCS